ncbi:hypothetical protein K2X40_04265 [Candidatus Babeliales bacterium]|nr:hypothetical protein [Candidatus Babeliales bacterium]
MKLLRSLFTFVLFFGLANQAVPGSIKDIKGTWNIFKPEHRLALSPVCGALDSETKLTEKMYYFGNPEHATVQLIKAIFKPVAGAFQPSKLNLPASWCSVRTIGKILGALEQNSGQSKSVMRNALINALTTDADFNEKSHIAQETLKSTITEKLGKPFSTSNEIRTLCEQTLKKYTQTKIHANDFLQREGVLAKGLKDHRLLLAKLKEYKNDSTWPTSSSSSSPSSSSSTLADDIQPSRKRGRLETAPENTAQRLCTRNDKQPQHSRKHERFGRQKAELTTKKQRTTNGILTHEHHDNSPEARDARHQNYLKSRAARKKEAQARQLFNLDEAIFVLQVKIDAPKIKQALSKLEAIEKNVHVAKFVDLIIASLAECKPAPADPASSSLIPSVFEPSEKNYRGAYEHYATQHILLTWLYRKAHDKHDLIAYVQSLPQEFLTPEAHNLNGTDMFEDNAHKEIQQAMAESLNHLDGKDIFDHLTNHANLADVVYTELMCQKFGQSIPYLPEYATVMFDVVKVADCVETTIRNLCNIATYDQETRTFGNKLLTPNAPEKLDNFYATKTQDATNNAEDDTNRLKVHQDWSNLVQNQPYITYAKIKLPGSSYTMDATQITDKKGKKKFCGFIKLPGGAIPDNAKRSTVTFKRDSQDITLETLKVNGNKFLLVAPDAGYQLYEIMPWMQNIIIMLNDLLGLNLFEAQAASSSATPSSELNDVFFDANFNATYFARVCQQCGWELAAPNFDLKKLDNQNIGQTILLKKARSFFTIFVNPLNHAYAERMEGQEAKEAYQNNLAEYMNNKLFDNADPVLFMLSNLYGLEPRYAHYRLLFMCDLLDVRTRLRIVRTIMQNPDTTSDSISLLSQLITSFELTEDLAYQRSLANILVEHLTAVQRFTKNPQFKNTLHDFVDKLSNQTHSTYAGAQILEQCVVIAHSTGDHQMLENLTHTALKHCAHKDYRTREQHWAILEKLVAHHHEPAINELKKLTASYATATQLPLMARIMRNPQPEPDISKRVKALEWYRLLTKNGHSIEEAANYAHQATIDLFMDSMSHKKPLELLTKLVESGLSVAFKPAAEAAYFCMTHRFAGVSHITSSANADAALKQESLRLFIKLAQHGEAFEKGLQSALLRIQMTGIARDISAVSDLLIKTILATSKHVTGEFYGIERLQAFMNDDTIKLEAKRRLQETVAEFMILDPLATPRALQESQIQDDPAPAAPASSSTWCAIQ